VVDDGRFADIVDVTSVLSDDGAPLEAPAESGRPQVYVSARGVEVVLRPGEAPILIAEGASGKSNPHIVELGSGYCLAWSEGGALKLRGLTSQGTPFGGEITIETGEIDVHGLAISGFGSGEGAPAGVSVAWVAAAGDGSGLGRIVMQRFSAGFDENGEPAALKPLPVEHQAPAGFFAGLLQAWFNTANDNAIEIAALGREPVLNVLNSGDTLVAWVGADAHVHGALIPAPAQDETGNVASKPDVGEYAALNAALAELGPVASGEAGQRRIKSLELGIGQIALMWLALGSTAFELRGVIITLPEDSGPDGASRASVVSIAPVVLPPGFDGSFEVAGLTDDGELAVTYGSGEGGTATVRVALLEAAFDARAYGEPSHESGSGEAGLALAGARHPSLGTAAEDDALTQGSATASPVPAGAGHSSPATQAVGLVGRFTVAGSEGDDGEDQTAPIVRATDSGFAAVWQVLREDGQTASLKLALYSSGATTASDGSAPAVYDVTDNADVAVAPAMTGTGDGAAIAWVEASNGQSQLILEVFEPEQGGSGRVIVDSGEAGDYSNISMASHTVDPDVAHGLEEQVAVVWVENADEEGYGSVNLQRYGVGKDDSGKTAEIVALGADGTVEGSNDPAELTRNDAPVIGRDPQAAGLAGGELAVVWIERGSGKGDSGSIQGVIIKGEEKGKGTQLDLKALMPYGVADDTKPIVFTTGSGEIRIAWLEPTRGDDHLGFDVKIAIFTPAGDNSWTPPSSAVMLHHLADEPDDFSLALGADASTLVLTWRDHDSKHVYVQNFALNGTELSAPVDVTAGSPQSDSDTASTAVLADGRAVVVYTEHQGADIDVKASVVDFENYPPTSSPPPGEAAEAGYSATAASGAAAADAYTPSDFTGFAADQALGGDTGSTSESSSGPGGDNPDWSGYSAPGGPDASEIVVRTEGDPVILDPLAGSNGSGFHVAAVNGIPISSDAPADVGSGFVQLRDDGKLLFSPDLDFSGEVEFNFTLADESGQTQQSAVRIEVVAPELSDELFSDDYGFDFEALTQPEKQINGSEAYFSESSLTAAAADESGSTSPEHHDYDLLVFKPGFGSDVINDFHGAPEEIIDISSYGYATFQALVDAGALMQVGDDVLITLTPSDPATSDKIVLKSYSVSSLAPDDFKLS
jgi:hypothetical protein